MTDKHMRVALIGHGFMGAVHSHAWRAVARAFDLRVAPTMSVICGSPHSADTLRVIADRYGWNGFATDWESVVDRDDIDLVDVCVPGDLHREVAVAALNLGKHVLCEKPLASSLTDGRDMANVALAARSRGIRSMVGFNYRRVPALALARELVAEGQIGEVRHVRGTYLQDWLVDPNVPLAWRMIKDRAGSGALGDIGSHVIDLAQFLTGARIAEVSARMKTFVKERPLVGNSNGAFLGGKGGEGVGAVTVDDAVAVLAELDSGCLATVEATRMAPGRKNALRIELNGSEGSLAFDFELMNELQLFNVRDVDRTNGFRRVLATDPSHPYLSGWWPPGHVLGYDHSFVNEIADFLGAISDGFDPAPSFDEGLAVQEVMDAVEKSAAERGQWMTVGAS